MKISLLSFFSGSGFLDSGFEDEGFSVDFVNEIHEPFLEAYQYARKMMGVDTPLCGYSTDDIRDFFNIEQGRLLDSVQASRNHADVIGFIGGPPCPDFSVGGKNRGRKGDKGQLSEAYVDLIIKHKPHFFLFENVKGLWRTKKHRKFYEELKTKLHNANYVTTERLVNAIEYGVPQDRDRIILIGFYAPDFDQPVEAFSGIVSEFPWMKHTKYSTDILKADWPDTEPFIENGLRNVFQNIPLKLTIQHWFLQNDVMNHLNAAHHFKPRAGLSKFMRIDEGDVSGKSYKRLHRWRYSPTAAYGNNEVHVHPYKARRLSAAEALAIQSLPANFFLPEDMSLTNMFKTIGNGVPYLAARGIARTLYDFIELNAHGTINTIRFSAGDEETGRSRSQPPGVSERGSLVAS